MLLTRTLIWFSLLIMIPDVLHAQVAATTSLELLGDPRDAHVPTQGGVVLMGGSTDVDEAFRWMIERASGGDFVIIRASGSTGYNSYIMEMGSVNSVETLLIDSREKAMDQATGQRIREADALFIAGGDQADYINFWSDSEVSAALSYLVLDKKIPIGGTSAGCAVLSEFVFDARQGTVTSAEALTNPFAAAVSISTSFIPVSYLKQTIADQHYSQRERLGRHVTFLARLVHDHHLTQIRGIGVDEKTAVCIDASGYARVFGYNRAYFLLATGSVPEVCEPNRALTWRKALDVHIVDASLAGTPAFSLPAWPATGAQEQWEVVNGELVRHKK